MLSGWTPDDRMPPLTRGNPRYLARRIHSRCTGGAVPDNRRIQNRHDVSIPAKLTIDGTPNDCTMLNISLGGALMAATTRYAMGARVKIAFAVPTVNHAIEIGATVRW